MRVTTTQSKNSRFTLHLACGDIDLREELRASINGGMRKVMGFVKQHDWRGVEWKSDGFDPFYNVNTPADMAQAELILQGKNK